MTKSALSVAVAAIAALVVVLPATATTPPPAVVGNVGIQVAKLGLAAGGVDRANAACTTSACLAKSYSVFYAQAKAVDHALEALWNASGQAGPCGTAAASLGAGFDALTSDYHRLQTAHQNHDKAAAASVYAKIEAKTPRLTSLLNSLKTKCR